MVYSGQEASVPTDTEFWRSLLEIEEAGYLWTTPHTFTPRLVDKVWGDGRRLMGISTINNRPAYWILRVDSAWNVGQRDTALDAPVFSEFTDEILDTIDDQFGAWRPDEEFEDDCADARRRHKRLPREQDYWGRSWQEFPRCDSGDGCHWFTLNWPGAAVDYDPSLLPLTRDLDPSQVGMTRSGMNPESPAPTPPRSPQ